MASKSVNLKFGKWQIPNLFYKVKYAKSTSGKVYGLTMPTLKLIVLNQDLSRFMMYETLAHERLHEIFGYLHIRKLDKVLDKIDVIK